MLRLTAVALCLGVMLPNSLAEVKTHIAGRQKRSISDEETSTCAEDYLATSVCVACADLPAGMELPLEACCNSKFVQMMCAACLLDLETCAKENLDFKVNELESGDLDERQDEEFPMSKRYGRLFMGSGRKYNYGSPNDKRYGKLFLSDSPYYSALRSYFPLTEKRFGTLFMGSRPRVGYPRNRDSEREKRFGTLFMNKRYGRLFLGTGKAKAREMDEKSVKDGLPIEPNEADRRKRFGRLFLSRHRPAEKGDKTNT